MAYLFFSVSILAGLFLVIIIGGAITRVYVLTPPFKGPDGKVLSGSIAEFRCIEPGGYSQAVLIHGKNLDNPMMLYLQAGSGLSETDMFRNMNAVLENYYARFKPTGRGEVILSISGL